MLNEVIDFLNDKNREYAEGNPTTSGASGQTNALAAANIWAPLYDAVCQVPSNIQSCGAGERVCEPDLETKETLRTMSRYSKMVLSVTRSTI